MPVVSCLTSLEPSLGHCAILSRCLRGSSGRTIGRTFVSSLDQNNAKAASSLEHLLGPTILSRGIRHHNLRLPLLRFISGPLSRFRHNASPTRYFGRSGHQTTEGPKRSVLTLCHRSNPDHSLTEQNRYTKLLGLPSSQAEMHLRFSTRDDLRQLPGARHKVCKPGTS